MNRTGVFYGVGVGPGDPELLTLKAVRVLKEAGAIAVPRSDSSAGDSSQALEIVKKAVSLDGKDIIGLPLPMTKDKERLSESRVEAAGRIASRLLDGSTVAFITLGDPMLYSTFSYLIPFVKELAPGSEVKVVPGITSFSSAASITASPLAESDERVIIIPAAYDLERVRQALDAAETVVLMKVNRAFDSVLALIEEKGLARSSFLVSRAGWPEEAVTADITKLRGKKLDYFSTLIIRKNG